MSLILWSLAFTIALLALRGIVRRVAALPAFKMLLLPGAVLGMAARAVACALARARLKEVRPPWSHGEAIEHEPPPAPIFGRLTLGSLPLLAGTSTILVLHRLLVPSLTAGHALPPVEHAAALDAYARGAADMVSGAIVAAGDPALQTWRTAAFIYLAVSILVFTAPRLSEWSVVAAAICGAALFLAALDFLGVSAGWLTRGWYIKRHYGPIAHEALALLLTLSLLSLAAAGTAFALASPALAARRRSSPKGRKREKKPS